jgi:hypothetical protein
MIRSRFVRSWVLALSAFATLSCSENSPTAPPLPGAISDQVAAQNALLGGLLEPVFATVGFVADATGLTIHAVAWNSSYVRVSYTVSGTITPWGGTLAIPQSDFTIVFPAGAVSQSTLITITSDPNYVGYKMEPQGLRFAKPVVVTQRLRKTAVYGQPLESKLFGAYVGDDILDLGTILHALEIELSTTIFVPGTSSYPDTETWIVNHFSRYMLASG